MRTLALLFLLCSFFAKTVVWQEATVVNFTSKESGTTAVVMPTGNGLIGASSTTTSGFYWIETEKITYVIHNYSEGSMVQRWLVLTIGAPAKIYLEGRNLHVLDTEGKERKCRILQQYDTAALHRSAK